MTKLDEILKARQFPGITMRQPVRSAVIRDREGRVSRIVYAGSEDTKTVERQTIDAAELDGVNLKTATMEVVEEHGQGVGKRGRTTEEVRRSRKPKYPLSQGGPGRALTQAEREEVE